MTVDRSRAAAPGRGERGPAPLDGGDECTDPGGLADLTRFPEVPHRFWSPFPASPRW
jgi:hypothetical protein